MRKSYLILIVVFSSCISRDVNSDLSIFRYNDASGIATLDPAFSRNQSIVWATNQIFNGLVQLDDQLLVRPSIAKSWKISQDGLRYEFLLRDDVFFHDDSLFLNGKGRRVVASDFDYSFSRLLDKELAAPGSWVLSNVEDFYAKNDSIFFIQLHKPFPAFLSLLSMQYCSVVPMEVVLGRDFNRSPVGTGPFKFQLWVDGVKLVLRKNTNYFEKVNGTRLPYLDAVSISFIKDKQSAFLNFIQGKFDFVSGIDPTYKDQILTSNGQLQEKYENQVNLYSEPYLNTEYLGFYMDSSLSIDIRKAINYGFDKVKMIRYLRNNIGTPAVNGFVPMGLPSFSDKIKGYDFNPEKAKKLIVSAIEKGDFDPNTEIVLSTTSSYLDLSEYIQHQLSEIGLKVKININPASTHREMIANSRLNFFRASWIADYPDAENFLSLFYGKNFSPNGPNYTHFNSSDFDRLFNEALSETNDSIRRSMYQQMDQIIIDNAVIVPLYYGRALLFTRKNVSGLRGNAMNQLNLKKVIIN